MRLMLTAMMAAAGFGVAAAEPDSDPFGATVKAYLAAYTGCDLERFRPLFADDHRGFVIRDGVNRGFTSASLKEQCDAGYRLRIDEKTIATFDHGDGNGSALIELQAHIIAPSGEERRSDLRISLMMADQGDGPKIVRSHISDLR